MFVHPTDASSTDTSSPSAVRLHPPFGECPQRMHDTPSAAACLGVAASSLEVDRCRRRWCIPTIRIGRRVLYRESDLLAFVNRCRKEG